MLSSEAQQLRNAQDGVLWPALRASTSIARLNGIRWEIPVVERHPVCTSALPTLDMGSG